MMVVEINTVEKTIVIEEATAKELIELFTKYNNFKVISKIVEIPTITQPYINPQPYYYDDVIKITSDGTGSTTYNGDALTNN